MKQFLSIIFMCICSTISYSQVAVSPTELSLADNKFVGSLWEPKGTVSYTKENNKELYGLVISLNTSDDFLDIYIGHKVSIEYIDGTRDIYVIKNSTKVLKIKKVGYNNINVYNCNIFITPNYENLINKEIKRIVIQRENGNIWVIDTKEKRAKKLMTEFKNEMAVAKNKYQTKVKNIDYFN